jgi:hypothetical protein
MLVLDLLNTSSSDFCTTERESTTTTHLQVSTWMTMVCRYTYVVTLSIFLTILLLDTIDVMVERAHFSSFFASFLIFDLIILSRICRGWRFVSCIFVQSSPIIIVIGLPSICFHGQYHEYSHASTASCQILSLADMLINKFEKYAK